MSRLRKGVRRLRRTKSTVNRPSLSTRPTRTAKLSQKERFNTNLQRCLQAVKNLPGARRCEVAKVLNMNTSSAQLYLNELTKRGQVESDQKRRYTAVNPKRRPLIQQEVI